MLQPLTVVGAYGGRRTTRNDVRCPACEQRYTSERGGFLVGSRPCHGCWASRRGKSVAQMCAYSRSTLPMSL